MLVRWTTIIVFLLCGLFKIQKHQIVVKGRLCIYGAAKVGDVAYYWLHCSWYSWLSLILWLHGLFACFIRSVSQSYGACCVFLSVRVFCASQSEKTTCFAQRSILYWISLQIISNMRNTLTTKTTVNTQLSNLDTHIWNKVLKIMKYWKWYIHYS